MTEQITQVGRAIVEPEKEVVIQYIGKFTGSPQAIISLHADFTEVTPQHSGKTLAERLNEAYDEDAEREDEENALYDFKVPELDVLAEVQGIEPIGDIDELVADFWPEEESVEDIMAAVRRWRDEGSGRHD